MPLIARTDITNPDIQKQVDELIDYMLSRYPGFVGNWLYVSEHCRRETGFRLPEWVHVYWGDNAPNR